MTDHAIELKRQTAKNIKDYYFGGCANNFLLDKFVQVDPDEVVRSVHDGVEFETIENYYIVLNQYWLLSLFIQKTTRGYLKDQHVFCFKCSFFDIHHQFIAVLHFGIRCKKQDAWTHDCAFIVRNRNQLQVNQLRKWYIQSLWNNDTEQNECYFAWIPEEVLSDVLDLTNE